MTAIHRPNFGVSLNADAVGSGALAVSVRCAGAAPLTFGLWIMPVYFLLSSPPPLGAH